MTADQIDKLAMSAAQPQNHTVRESSLKRIPTGGSVATNPFKAFREAIFAEIKSYNKNLIDNASCYVPSPRVRTDKFVCPVDYIFVKEYAVEQMQDLLKQENKLKFQYLFDISKHVDRDTNMEFQIKFGDVRLRASLVDKIFNIGSMPELNQQDKSVLFQTIAIFDKFYENEARTFLQYKRNGQLLQEKEVQFTSIRNPRD